MKGGNSSNLSVFGHPLSKSDNRITRTILPISLCVILGIAASIMILAQEWIGLLAILVLVPAALLVVIYPFSSILAWLAIFPFFVELANPGARSIYWILHRAMIPGTLLVLIVLHLSGIRRSRSLRWGVAEYFMLAFLVLGFANITLMTDNPQAEYIRFYDRIVVPFCLYWLVRLLNPTKKDLQNMIPVALWVIVSQSLIGGLSWFAPQVLPSQWLNRVDERTVGTLANPAVFTTTLVFCALLLMQAFHEKKSGMIRWVYLLAVGIAFLAVFFSFSRASWGGALLVWAGLYYLYPKTIGKVTLIGGILAAFIFLVTPLKSYLGFAEQRLVTESTAEGRVIGGAATMRMIAEKPLLGWGYNNHEKYDEQFRDRVLGLAINNEHSSHNTYLLITAEMGFLGVLVYLFPTIIWLIRSFIFGRYLPQQGYPSRVLLIMFWLLLADHVIVSNFTDLIQSTFFSTGMWWLVLGLIANMVEHARKQAVTGGFDVKPAY